MIQQRQRKDVAEGQATVDKSHHRATATAVVQEDEDPSHAILKSEGSSDSYNDPLYACNGNENERTTPVTPITVNLMELAIVALGSSISAAKPIQRLSLHPCYADEDTLFAVHGPSFPSEEELVHSTHSDSQHHKPMHPPNQTQTHHRRDDSIRLKLDGTVVTDADGAAQRIICSSLQQISKHVRIVAEESKLEAEISTHNVRDRVWSGLSPLTKRRLMTEEEEQQDDIMNGARQEIYQRIQQVTRKRNWSIRDQWHQSFSIPRNNHDPSSVSSSAATAAAASRHDQHSKDDHHTDDDQDIENWLSMYNVDAHRVAIFVDPLDGTGCYAKGEYDAVTILTAIVLDNIPIFGSICKPFAIDPFTMSHTGQASASFSTTTTTTTTLSSQLSSMDIDFTHTFLNSGCFVVYGGILLQGAFIAGDQELVASRFFYEPWEKEMKDSSQDDDSQRKAIISKSRSGGVVAKCIDSLSKSGLLSPEPIHIAGAGYKALRLLLAYENECLWFFPKPGTSLWDVAAADALLRVVGGRLTDKYSKPLDYSKARLEAENVHGIVASNDSNLHRICIERYQDEAWSDDEE